MLMPASGSPPTGTSWFLASWNGTGWNSPQVLWFGQKGILGFSFTAETSGEGYVVLASDEDGDLSTRTDRELYAAATVSGVWRLPVRLTNDGIEDASPVLVAPNGVPICIWNKNGSTNSTLVYSRLSPWNPTPVYGQYTLANEAATLEGITLPSRAAIAYTVQGTNGIDIFASFYDAALDRWSLPRRLTQDGDAESALSLASDGTNLVTAYLKTQTLRTNLDVVINGQTNHLENIPQPGRTDLCLLRHELGYDVAIVPGSLLVDPTNPPPGTVATLTATVENRGDLPLAGIQLAFYDGPPGSGGVMIGTLQTLAGPFIGGATQAVSTVWTAPASANWHDVYVIADPGLVLNDRDRSNNSDVRRTVLPDLTIETCWSTEVSMSEVALMARLVNTGVVSTVPFEVSWRVGRADGEEIGTQCDR